ncbi:MAG: ubiquinol-cytochrome c reductase iron-sulfur subunit [Candidatus Sericytochromatia bacterium]|nr:ubiquinol-cytochrome c reductase iron-sulfur subunit [Candidatus Sericytochromatia bacterium]
MADTAGTAPTSTSDDITRRKFLNQAINVVGAGITAILAVPLTAYFLDPAVRSSASKKNWVKLGPASDLTASPKAFNFQTVRTEGFMKQNVNATAYAFMDDAGQPQALSNTCTHLGCPAGWDEAKGKFFCPCHGGVYTKDGTNVAGPPPRPLPRFEAKVENGDVYINA